MTEVLDPTRAREQLWEMIRDVRFALLTSRQPDGGLRSRPLTTQNRSEDTDETIYFFVSAGSDVVADVMADPRVGVGYADPDKDRYVSITGRAQVHTDLPRQGELWSPLARAWFPGGPDDPDLRLLEVHIDNAEYWDVRSSKMVQLFSMAKAAMTGKPPRAIGEHGQVTMS